MVVINTLILIPLSYLFVFSGRLGYFDVVRLFAFGTPILCLIFTVLFLLDPKLADGLAMEDSVIEYLTAVFALQASLITLGVGIYLAIKRSAIAAIMAALTALGFFVIGMEEISWMQRIFDLNVPEYFVQRNIQQEINLHNLNTVLTMNIFYMGAFFGFVFIPFFSEKISKVFTKLRLPALELFIPSKWLVLPVLLSLAFASSNFSTSLNHTVMVVFTILVICRYLLSQEEFNEVLLPMYLSLIIYAVSAVALGLQDPDAGGFRLWAVSEYREFFLCLTIFIYALELPVKAKDYFNKPSPRKIRQPKEA